MKASDFAESGTQLLLADGSVVHIVYVSTCYQEVMVHEPGKRELVRHSMSLWAPLDASAVRLAIGRCDVCEDAWDFMRGADEDLS